MGTDRITQSLHTFETYVLEMFQRFSKLGDDSNEATLSIQQAHVAAVSLGVSFVASDFELSEETDQEWGTSEFELFKELVVELTDVDELDDFSAKALFAFSAEKFEPLKYDNVKLLCLPASIIEVVNNDEEISVLAERTLDFIADLISLNGVNEQEIYDFATIAAMFNLIEYAIWDIRDSECAPDVAIDLASQAVKEIAQMTPAQFFQKAAELAEDGHPFPSGTYKNDRMWEIFTEWIETGDFSDVDVSEFHPSVATEQPARPTIGNNSVTPRSSTSNEASALVRDHAVTEANSNGTSASLQQLLDELDDLVGLTDVKNEVKRLASRASIDKKRREAGLAIAAPTRHLVFTGNPGTGKTSVARILAGIFREVGILRNGQLVEVGKSDLVAGYLGQTATKVTTVVEKALGGVLFIDEAYSLKTREDDSFGQEAIDTLVAEMENQREDLIVMIAGYPTEMTEFITLNPGLASRFPRTITFTDYSPEELVDIFLRMIAKAEYQADQHAKKAITAYLINHASTTGFGNARGVRNFFDKVIDSQSTRIALVANPSREDLMTITAADIEQIP